MCGLDASTAKLGLEAGYFVKQICTITLHGNKQSSGRDECLLAFPMHIFFVELLVQF